MSTRNAFVVDVTEILARHIDDAAGIDHVVGCIKDARVCQPLPVLRAAQLVVGAPGNDPGLDSRDRFLVQNSPECAGRENVGKDGVVRDPAVHEAVCARVKEWVEGQGWQVQGIVESPIKGPEGNVEFLLSAQRPL